MTLGSVLLRPQAFAEAPAETQPPLDTALRLLSLVARDLTGEGRALSVIEDEVTAALERLAGGVESRLEAAGASVQAMLDPLIGSVSGAVGEADPTDPAAMAASGAAMVQLLERALRALAPDRVGTTLGRLFDVLEQDLGLDQASFAAAFDGSFDRIAARLQADLGKPGADAGAGDRFALGVSIQELRGSFADAPSLPKIGKDALLPPLVGALQASGIPAVVGRLADQLEQVSQVLQPLAAIQTLGASLSVSTHAAGGPSPKALPKDPPPGGSGEGPTVTPGPTPMSGPNTAWYASWYTGEKQTTSVDPAGHPLLAEVKFNNISPKAMEAHAFHSRWIADLLEAILHASSIERGDIWANFANVLWRTGEAALAGFGDIALPTWSRWLIGGGLTALGGLEGARFYDWFGPYIMLSDLGQAQLLARWVWLSRELWLSILTLHNGNVDRIEGLAYAFGELGMLTIAGIVSAADPNAYGFPDGGGSWGTVVAYSLVLSILMWAAFAYLAGGLLPRLGFLAGAAPEAGNVFRLVLKERMFFKLSASSAAAGAGSVFAALIPLITYPLDFFFYWFLLCEGKTDDGKMSGLDSSGNEIPMHGYAPKQGTPYKLPWAKDDAELCAQGNRGIFSHTPFSNRSELYAYDFAMGKDSEALAMRGGIVWDFAESTKDGEEPKNVITVMHSGAPLATYDVDRTNVTARTFSEYLHGKENGITLAFGGTTPLKGKDGKVTAVVKTPAAGKFTVRCTVARSDDAQPFSVGGSIGTAGAAVADFDRTWQITAVGGAKGAWEFEATSDTDPGMPTAPFGFAGTPVVQGQLVMRTDSTGRSAYNHLHVQIRPTKATSTNPDDYTIPFVFADSDLGDDGRPRSFDTHLSDNVKV